MYSNFLTIFLGVASGILSYFLIEALSILYKTKFIPWIEQRLYRDIDLTDTWIETYVPLDPFEKENNGQEQTITLELKQKAHIVTGMAILTDNSATKTPVGTRRMTVMGSMNNRHVSLQLKLENKKKFGLVTYLLEVTSGGDKMIGFTSYYNPLDKEISTAECTLERQASNI